jgi:hypothetical protein
MKIKPISKSEFHKLDPARQVITHDHPQKFAVLDLGEPLGCYGLSWRSELIEPIIELSTDGSTLWIGVDQRLAAIDMQQGNICIAMPLATSIFQILIVDNFTAILTELEVLLFSSNHSLTCFHALPDLSSKISVSASDFVISMFDNSSFILTRSGVLKETSPVQRISK